MIVYTSTLGSRAARKSVRKGGPRKMYRMTLFFPLPTLRQNDLL